MSEAEIFFFLLYKININAQFVDKLSYSECAH